MRIFTAVPAMLLNSALSLQIQHRAMVNLHGPVILAAPSRTATSSRRGRSAGASLAKSHVIMQPTATGSSSIRTSNSMEPPPNPSKLLTESELEEKVDLLLNWWEGKRQVLCITGAGLSTESGLTDYRGHEGSYHRGHKPMIHDQFMNSEYQRKRYWGRGMVGWRNFDQAKPNAGHFGLASLERNKKIGVTFDDQPEFYPESDSSEWLFSNGQRKLSIITQNVDSLHRRSGSQNVCELHGRTDVVKCMSCETKRDRNSFHMELETINKDWLEDAMKRLNETELRPDGDAALQQDDYNAVQVPSCTNCGDGFFKPTVVFFGDNVPRHRVATCTAAVDAADGLLVIGSSLAVYSAFRHVRAAHQKGIPIAILNVGDTRAEVEGLNVTKIEAPAGPTLSRVAEHFERIKKEF